MSKDRWAMLRWVLVAVVLFVGILAMPKTQYIGDPLAIRAAAANWINTGNLDVPEEVALSSGQRGQYYFQNPRNGRYYSKYGSFNTISYIPVLALERGLNNGALPLYNENTLRTALLNGQNITLTLALALVLWQMGRLYCDKPWLVLVWVLANLYASFGWNYLRAQTSELLQWVLASAFLLLIMTYWRDREHQGVCLWWGQLALVLLILTKGVYALWGIIWVALVVAVYRGSQSSQDEAHKMSWVEWLKKSSPLLLGAVLVLALNYFKFGDALASGYTQWDREIHFFSGNICEGLWGFLASVDKSIFIYCPLLLIALWCWPEFWKRYRWEGMAIVLAFASLWIFNSCTINWGGHWSYGPRYLLAALTPMTLPALLLWERCWEKRQSWGARLILFASAILLTVSLWMQVQVNSLEYFTYYRVEAVIKACGSQRALDELHRLPFGMVNYQLRRFRSTDELPHFAQVASVEMSPSMASALQGELLRQAKSNWFWFD